MLSLSLTPFSTMANKKEKEEARVNTESSMAMAMGTSRQVKPSQVKARAINKRQSCSQVKYRKSALSSLFFSSSC